MGRREIVKAAKQLVAHDGPFRVLEFGSELLNNVCVPDDPRYPHREEILQEACRQAIRVLDFLGM